ncbi:right-handed parallel beta-helix repeat-containing protein [Rahnella sp. FC061912-K]|uniref:phage tailspike protein n=1 Tax=Rahnella rivi TaxID=2816249 RepID=UPI001C26FEC5|nr:phage tailspike protein [Rahnella rivi]MBU9829887.1 right-handed parallel beta-helix repeat-containing protein [Rahnella rivi]
MADIIPNVVVSMPSQLFTLARSFKAAANGKIYIGKIDTDPTIPTNRIQVYLENEDGSHVPVNQPILINAGGYPVYLGQVSKFVTIEGHSMAIYDFIGVQQFYFPNILKYDPDQFQQRLSSYSDGQGDALVAVKQPIEHAKEMTQHAFNSLEVNLAHIKGGDPDGTDTQLAMQSLINHLSSKGGGSLNVTVSGTYLFSSELTLLSNVKINLGEGVVLKKNYSGGVFFRVNPSSANNIGVFGGTIDGGGQTYPTESFDIFAVTSARGITFQRTTFLDVVDFHAIDLADCRDVVVRDCKFLGFKPLVDRTYSEAIQLDPGFDSTGSYLPNINVTVDNCYFGPNPSNPVSGFGSWGAGVGNHANAYGNQDKNIKIINSRFENMLFAGVRVFNWNDYLISGCTFIGGTARGIHVTPFPNSVKPQGSRRGRIIGNNFDGVRSPVLLAAPTYPYTDASDAFHEDIVVSNNTMVMTEDLSAAIDARWCSGLTVTGNVASGGNGFFAGRFVNKTVVSNNQYNDGTSSGIWIAETDATLFISTGLTYDIIIAGNLLRNISLNGVHVNAACKNVNVSNNIIIGASSADTTHNGIRVDAAAANVNVSNNQVRDGGAANKPGVGIAATSTCVNILFSGNQSFGTAATHNNQGTGNSSVIIFGDTGLPSSSANAVGAPVGSIYTRQDGGALTTLYVKESGTSSAGWVAK